MLQILLLLHCFWCICPHVSVMNSGDLPTLIHPECALQRREHDRVKASVLLHCWGAETLRRLCSVFSVWYPPNPPVSPAASALQPPSPGLQLRWRPSLLLANLAVHLCCAGGAVESSSARHLPCSAIHPLSSH